MDLFEVGQDDRLEESSINVNKQFAEKYEAKKRREELSNLKDKYGQGLDDSEDETDYSSEDSDAELVTPQVDAAILKIIGRIQAKDTSLYDSEGNLFQVEEQKLGQALKAVNAERKKRNAKPMKLKDYQRRALLANAANGFASDEEEGQTALSTRTPAQEEQALKEETKAAFFNAVDGDGSENGSDDEDDLLVRRDGAESEDDEDQYKRFLLENVGEKELNKILAMRPEPSSEGIAPISDQKAEDDFLKNFILNRGWLDKKSNHLPSYKEIVMEDEGPAPGPSASGANAIGLDHEGSDEELEKAEEFENRYNFRFEEASGSEILTHARDVGTSMRREDNSRKQARDSAAARKAEEKAEHMRARDRLNTLKKQEILDKIAQIKKVAGAAEGFDMTALDLEAEYDPETHDSKMQRIFNDLFYQDTGVDANGKPIWDDDIDVSDIVPEEDYAPGGDAYDPAEAGMSSKKSRADRKKEKKQKKRDKGKGKAEEAEAEAEETGLNEEDLDAIADPEERRRRVEQYMEEYYKLDHEDMIGDLPTRFHYTTNALNPRGISMNGEGLTPAEILMATDAELNAYESLRRLAPYRRPDERERSNRKKMKELKKAVAKRKWGEELPPEEEYTFKDYSASKRPHDGSGDAEQPKAKEKRLGKKQRQKLKARETADGEHVA